MILKFVKKSCIYLFLYSGALLILLPFIWMISTSLKTPDEIFTLPIRWIPSKFYFENYKVALNAFPFMKFFFNSIIVTAGIIGGQIFTSILCAYAFAKMKFKGKNILFMLLLTGLMIPDHTIMIPMTMILKKLGMINSYIGLIVPFSWSALIVFLFRQFFMKIPDEIEEAAKIDGCNIFQIIFKIVIPVSKPIISTAVILIFVYAWNQYLWPLLIVNKETLYTLQLGLAYFKEYNDVETNWGALMAGTALTIIPIVVVFSIFQKKIIDSIAFSGDKE